MIYLHPSQRAIANATFNGPARVRGGPGTGKTVVALHRARVTRTSARRGARQGPPDDVPEHAPQGVDVAHGTARRAALQRLDIRNIDQLARELVAADARGGLTILDAAARTKTAEGLLKRHGLANAMADNAQLLLDEFDAFIAGRGIETLDDYLALRRRGGEAASVALIASGYSQPSGIPSRAAKRKAYDWPHIRSRRSNSLGAALARATTASSSTRPRTSARWECAAARARREREPPPLPDRRRRPAVDLPWRLRASRGRCGHRREIPGSDSELAQHVVCVDRGACRDGGSGVRRSRRGRRPASYG